MTSWSFNGIDLSTFGYVTLLDDYLDIPDRRGSNKTIPRKHGTIHVNKFYDEREIAMGIAIKRGTAALLETALDDLKRALSSRTPKTLSNIRADGSVRTALATVDKDIQSRRESALFVRVVVVFLLADPFFQGTTLVSEEITLDSSPKELEVENAGTVEKINPKIVLTGPLGDVTITNPLNGNELMYTGGVVSPRIVTIQEEQGQITVKDDLGENMVANFSHSGSEGIIILETGDNPLQITDTIHTTGKVKVEFYPPYL